MSRLQRMFMRLFFRLLYNEFSFTYDWVAAIVSLGAWKSWGLSALEHTRGPRILELGFGPGHLQRALKAQGLEPVGLDVSPWMARRLKHKTRDLDLVQGLAQHLPFPSERFDQVVATFPSEYIWDPLTLSECWRVLRSDGCLVIVAYARLTGQGLPARATKWLFQVTGQAAPESAMQELFRKFSERLQAQGFRVEASWKNLPTSEVFLIQSFKSS